MKRILITHLRMGVVICRRSLHICKKTCIPHVFFCVIASMCEAIQEAFGFLKTMDHHVAAPLAMTNNSVIVSMSEVIQETFCKFKNFVIVYM